MELTQLQCESLQIKFSVGAVSSFMPTYVTSKTVFLQNMLMFCKYRIRN